MIPNTIQLTCPRCKHEFPFPYGQVDKEIHSLNLQRNKVIAKLHEINKRDFERTCGAERKKIIAELDNLDSEIRRLKGIRKAASLNHDKTVFDNFKMAVLDVVGRDEYLRILEYAENESKAYELAQMMKRPYQRARYKAEVVSISKL